MGPKGWAMMPPGSTPRLVLAIGAGLVALWIATGANPKQVSTRAGHTSVSFTFDRYGSLFEDADETLAVLLDAVYDPGSPT